VLNLSNVFSFEENNEVFTYSFYKVEENTPCLEANNSSEML
jgi:hypothetical protein